MPVYANIDPIVMPGLLNPIKAGSITRVTTPIMVKATLNLALNQLFLEVNQYRNELTHFLILHTDIGAPLGFIDTLLEEMEIHNADVMAASVPVKSNTGLRVIGSLKSDLKTTHWLTKSEEEQLPDTYNQDDLNTLFGDQGIFWYSMGCCLFKMGSWMDSFKGFRWMDWIEGGVAYCLNEDQCFQIDNPNLKQYVTKKVKCFHSGNNVWV